MKIYQAYNSKTKAWVKYCFGKKGAKVLNVKEREPKKPFKGIPIRGNRKN